jgi:hypothetical protein
MKYISPLRAYYDTTMVALLEGISKRRVQAKIKQSHYPHAEKCPLGLLTTGDLKCNPLLIKEKL